MFLFFSASSYLKNKKINIINYEKNTGIVVYKRRKDYVKIYTFNPSIKMNLKNYFTKCKN